ncbi:MAG: hypothetical protein ACE5FB_00565 [Candidatus Binatia bacterium]
MLLLVLIVLGIIIWYIVQQHKPSSRSSRPSGGRVGRQVSNVTSTARRLTNSRIPRQVFGNPPYKVVDYYRTSDGTGTDYGFSFERQADGTWRVYIICQPSYGRRSTGAHETHRLTDGSRKYICWNRSLNTLQEAMQVAALWSDKTQEYIRTGRRF